MSGIGGISSNWLQNNLFATPQGPQTAGQVRDADGDNDNSPAAQAATAAGAGGAAGASPASALRDQIVAAVKSAVANFDPNGGLDDLKRTIQTTVQDTLKKNGVDPVQAKVSRGKGHHHHAHAAGGGMPVQPANDPFGPAPGSAPTDPPAPASGSTTSNPASAEEVKNQIISGILASTDNSATLAAVLPLLGASPSGVVIDRQA